jgi:hypothetical protein
MDTIKFVSMFTNRVVSNAQGLLAVWLVLQLLLVIGSPACGVHIAADPGPLALAFQTVNHSPDAASADAADPCVKDATLSATGATERGPAMLTLQVDTQSDLFIPVPRTNLGLTAYPAASAHPVALAALEPPPIASL